MNTHENFAVTRDKIDRLDAWIGRLAKPLLPATRVPTNTSFRWKFREDTALVLLVAKAVRMASAVRAAMMLADAGFVTECACLLRIVGDLGVEVTAVSEGELRGERTKAQQDFVDQFFARPTLQSFLPGPPPRKDFVGRDDLMKAHVRLAEAAGQGEDKEVVRDLIRALSWGYDGYVHGDYSSAMELYHGGRDEFMLKGHEADERRGVYRLAVSTKLVEVINALRLVAIVERDQALSKELGEAAKTLMASPEQERARGG